MTVAWTGHFIFGVIFKMPCKPLSPKERIERFWSYVNKKGPYPDPKKYPKLKTRCWIWTRSLCKGYGQFSIASCKMEYAHRFAFQTTYPDIDIGGYQVCHKCDNELCCRPSHLFRGTNLDNSLDKCKKERQWKKLTILQRKEIKRLYKLGNLTQREIGRKYKVTDVTISAIVRGVG